MKLTDQLLEELFQSDELDEFLEENRLNEIIELHQYLNQLLIEKDLKKSKVIKESQLNETFAYQIFSGSRKASRDKILQLAFAMRLSIKETERLLFCGNAKTLYCKDKRDAIILYGLKNQYTLEEVESTLHEFNEKTLCGEV